MSDISARLELPYLAPSQAQKHVTHNEALLRLDALTQLVLEEAEATTPPTVPVAGALYALGSAPTDAWAAEAGKLAYWDGTGWLFLTPSEGWRAWDKAATRLRIYQGGAWVAQVSDLQNVDGLGIATTSDAVNRLAVASEATLLSHAGAGHQLKLNKAAAVDTASLLYQSNWTGHAEMGLTGSTDFHIKVSPDGSAWTDAMVFDATSGIVSGAAVQNGPSDTTAGRLARADYAYGPGNVVGTVAQTGGSPTGAVLENGGNGNGQYVRYADGTQLCYHTRGLFASGPANWNFPAPFASAPKVFGTAQQATSALCFANEYAPTATQARVSLRNTSNSRVGGTIDLMAIGRWF